MKISQDSKRPNRIGIGCVLGLVLCSIISADAFAQGRRGGGPQLSPEKAEETWKIQAKGVSQDLSLSKEDSAELTEAYVAARRSHQKGRQELFASGGGIDRERYQAYLKLTREEHAKLETALKASLTEEQVGNAIMSLGAFSNQWDSYVDTLTGFELDKENLGSALEHTRVYVIEYEKARVLATSRNDVQLFHSSRQKSKEKLDTELAKLLTEEQLTKWKEATILRTGQGGQRPRGSS